MDNDINKREVETCLRDILQKVEEWLNHKNGLQRDQIPTAAETLKKEFNYRQWERQDDYAGINYNDMKNCSGYLHRYALCHSALTRKATRFVLIQEPNGELAKLMSGKRCLKVVSAGGGPGNDLLGFFCAASDVLTQLTELHLTAVDLKGGWNNAFYKVMSEVRTNGSYGKIGEFFQRLPCVYKFKKQNLCIGVPFELSDADLILMVKVLSHVSTHQKNCILENVFRSMKVGSLFLYIDVDTGFVRAKKDPYMEEVFVKHERRRFSCRAASNTIRQSSYEICILKRT